MQKIFITLDLDLLWIVKFYKKKDETREKSVLLDNNIKKIDKYCKNELEFYAQTLYSAGGNAARKCGFYS